MAADAPVESFFSPYAPLNPEGPLPPGLDERVVANAYKATRVLPKRVLVELGIRRYTETAAVRLRKALDNPAARARLSSPASRVKPLHQAIYSLLRSQPAYRAVYKRLVEPSEVEVRQESGEKVWELDPAEFTARVTADQLDSSWSASEVTAQSDEEALVLFALAYALLQPEDAQKILAPVLGIGESFREFFAATTNLISEQATKSLEEIPLSSAQVGGTLTTVLKTTPRMSTGMEM
jgi:hypothetical protein